MAECVQPSGRRAHSVECRKGPCGGLSPRGKCFAVLSVPPHRLHHADVGAAGFVAVQDRSDGFSWKFTSSFFPGSITTFSSFYLCLYLPFSIFPWSSFAPSLIFPSSHFLFFLSVPPSFLLLFPLHSYFFPPSLPCFLFFSLFLFSSSFFPLTIPGFCPLQAYFHPFLRFFIFRLFSFSISILASRQVDSKLLLQNILFSTFAFLSHR